MSREFDEIMKVRKAEHLIEDEYEYDKWIKEIPTINFPSDWEIKIIPPFGGAIVRFHVIKGDRQLSVYLDCYNRLGSHGGEPYWEIYPSLNMLGVERFAMNDVEGLLQEIKETLEYREDD